MPSSGRHHPRTIRSARTLGLCATAALGGMVTVAAAPSPGLNPNFIAAHASTAFGLAPADQSALAERDDTDERASRDLVRMPAAARRALPAPAAQPAPAPAPAPAAPAPAAAPKTAAPKAAAAPKAPAPKAAAPQGFSTSTARTGADVERGLTANAMKVLNAVRAAYPQLSNIGGRRSDAGSDHGTGQALDVMISSQAVGDALAAFIQSHAGELGVAYVIWRQRIWTPGRGGWRGMSDRGSATANHYDHVHISVN